MKTKSFDELLKGSWIELSRCYVRADLYLQWFGRAMYIKRCKERNIPAIY